MKVAGNQTDHESLPTTGRFPVNDLRLLETGSSHAGSEGRFADKPGVRAFAGLIF
jgi:hypothetical protein